MVAVLTRHLPSADAVVICKRLTSCQLAGQMRTEVLRPDPPLAGGTAQDEGHPMTPITAADTVAGVYLTFICAQKQVKPPR